MKKLLLLAALCGVFSQVSYANNALAVVQNASGVVNHKIKVFAQFTYDVQNPTNSYQNYAGVEKIEAFGRVHNNPISFTLPPYGSIRKSDTGILEITPNTVGEFKSRASLVISGTPSLAHASTGKVKVVE